MLKQFHHIGFVVRDLNRIIDLMEKTYGLKVDRRISIKDRQMEAVLYKLGDAYLEYLAPTSEGSPLQSFIDKNGEGFHHIACLVDSITKARDVLPEGVLLESRRSDVGSWTIADFDKEFDSVFITQIIEKDK
jgi:methylmalonyl-CoA/ethylmalonyl-CoA epimerase